jgi:guanidinopropionase
VTDPRVTLRPTSPFDMPRFADVATFMRAPRVTDLDVVDIGVLGIPFDLGSTFRGGSREGPSAIREASRPTRLENPTTGVRPFELANVADLGDTPLNPLKIEESIDGIQRFLENVHAHDVWPLSIGGDHTISLPILRAIAAERPVGLVHFDAHLDTWDEFYGTKLNNGTFLRRALEEGLVDPQRVVQIGLRVWSGGAGNDLDFARDAGFTVITFDDFEEMGRAAVIEKTREVIGDGPAYVTYDVDALDQTEAPGCAGRAPGGLSMRDSQVVLRGLTGLQIVGGDVNEVSPWLDPAGITQVAASSLMFEILCLMATAHAAAHDGVAG